MNYLGAFRLPYDGLAGVNFSNAGMIAADRDGDLWMLTRQNVLVRLVQPARLFPDPIGDQTLESIAQWGEVNRDLMLTSPSNGYAIAGLLLDSRPTVVTSINYYDANNTQRVGHYDYVNNQWRAVWNATRQGYVAGYMCWVPEKWRAQIGDFVTGQCGIPIVTRTSRGPAAFGVRLIDFDPVGIVPARPLVYYDEPRLPYEAYNDTLQIAGCAFDRGDEDLCFFGSIGTGPYCYGDKTNDPALHNTPGVTTLCYDPEPGRAVKGGHAYPYRYQVWRYRVQDLLDAVNPWDVQPTIETLPAEWVSPRSITRLIGLASHGDRIYVSQYQAENNFRVAAYPIVRVLEKTPAPVPTPKPQPPTVEEQLAEANRKLDAIRAVVS